MPPEDTINRLAELYLSRGGRTMMDPDAFLSASQAVFELLGWTVLVYRVVGDTVELHRMLAPREQDDEAIRFLRDLSSQPVPIEQLPTLAECVRTGRGQFHENTPATAERLQLALTGDAAEARRVADAMQRAGWQRRACAPVVVGERLRYLVIAFGTSLEARDFAAIQLFAAQLAASELLHELSEDTVRQHRLAALGQLSMLVAHEVRNPLAVIFQACRQLRRLADGSGDQLELLNILDEEANRLKRLADDLVHFAGPTQPRIQAVDLGEVLHWSRLSLIEAGETQSERLEVRLDPAAALVQADPLLLRQALAYLLAHAFQHAGAKGRVWVESEGRPDGVRLRVHNSGPPLADDLAKRLFEPFFSTKGAESGLGLAAVRRLVEDQGCRVQLDRDEDHCAFSVFLPAA